MSDGDFLSRWSRRKTAVRKGEKLAAEAGAEGPAAAAVPAKAGAQPAAAATPAESKPPEPLPPIESLTIDSDFSPFMKAEVDPGMRRQALKVLLRDPRFNVMDGLDVYIDDYSKPDPLPAEWLGQLNQTKHFGHYIEKALEGAENEAPREAPEPSVQLQKPIPEQPVEAPAADTAGLQNPDAGVGESEASGK